MLHMNLSAFSGSDNMVSFPGPNANPSQNSQAVGPIKPASGHDIDDLYGAAQHAPVKTPVKQPNCFDKVPMALKKLVRLAVSAFYGVEQGLIIDYLIHYPCLREDHLAEVLKLERKHLRAILAPLRADHVVKAQMRVVIMTTSSSQYQGGQQQFYYYYVDYGAAANAIRYRLDRMVEALESEETRASTRSTFRCSNATCHATYSDLDVDRLFDPATGDLFCTVCGSLVVLEGDDNHKILPAVQPSSAGTTKREARKAISQFNIQFESLFSMLRKVENVILAPHLAKPEPLELDLDNLMNVKRGLTSGPYDSISNGMGKNDPNGQGAKSWKNESFVYKNAAEYEWYKTGVTINIQSSVESHRMHLQNSMFLGSGLAAGGARDRKFQFTSKVLRKKELPQWLSTTSSNIIQDYKTKIMGLKDNDIDDHSTPENDEKSHFRKSNGYTSGKRFKVSHSGTKLENQTSDVISQWGSNGNARYKRGAPCNGIAVEQDEEGDNLEETISRTLLVYESKGSAKNVDPKISQPDTNSSGLVDKDLANSYVNDFGEPQILEHDNYPPYDRMDAGNPLETKQHPSKIDSALNDDGNEPSTIYVSHLSPCIVISGIKVSLFDIDSKWLSRMSPYEKDLYFKISKELFTLLFDAS